MCIIRIDRLSIALLIEYVFIITADTVGKGLLDHRLPLTSFLQHKFQHDQFPLSANVARFSYFCFLTVSDLPRT